MDTNKPKVGPKDFFLQLATLIALYMSVGSLLGLIFDIINKTYPDALNGAYYYDAYSSGLRFEIASLVIVFPLFCVLAWFIRKEFARFPEKQDLWVRKWATYLTMFVSGATIVVTLIMLLNDFLGGELSLRFALKALATIVIAAIIFIYFLMDVRKGAAFTEKNRKAFLIGAAVFVLASLITGFVVIGSPFQERAYRLDEQRVSNLQSMQWQIVNYWQSHETLPANLAALNDPISGYMTPTDPEGKVFSYEKTGDLSFKLCADFSAESRAYGNSGAVVAPTEPYSSGYPTDANAKLESWNHGVGTQCFTRTIDTKLYPARKAVQGV